MPMECQRFRISAECLAIACGKADRYERQLRELGHFSEEGPRDDDPPDGYDEDETDIRRSEYRRALKQLSHSLPELKLSVSQQVKGVPATEDNSWLCSCGDGRLPQWPWMLQTRVLGYCTCEQAEWVGTFICGVVTGSGLVSRISHGR